MVPTVVRGRTFWTRIVLVLRIRPYLRLLAISASLGAASAVAQDERDGLLAEVTEPSPAKPGIAFFEELTKKSPDEAANHQMLAAAYGRQGRVDDARRSARRAIELAPTVAEFQQTLGLIEEGADNLPAAEAAFKKAASLDGNVEYRLDTARVLWRLDRRPEAETAWAAVATDFGESRDVQLALANSFHGLGRNEEALATYERALTLSKTGAERSDVLVEMSRVHADRGAINLALEGLSRARDAAPTDPEIHYNLGVLYFRAGQYDAAVASFDDAVKLKADHANALNNKGVTLEKQRKLDEAATAFKAAIAVDGNNGFAHFNLGLVLFKLRRFKEAEASFERATVVDPELGDAKFFLGEICFQLGDTKKALRLYKDALHSNPDDASTHRRVGDIHLQSGELDLAIGEYWAAVDADADAADHRAQLMRVLVARNNDGDVRRAVKLGEAGLAKHPEQLEVRTALATAEVAARRSERARQLLEEGTQVAPKDPAAHTAYARFLLEQGKVSDADASFAIAVKLDPRHASAIAGQGEAALSQGDTPKAEKAFQAALELDPGLASARAELGYIFFKADKNDAALRELGRAVEDDSRLGRAWFYLAFAQYKAGQKDKVEASLKKAVAVQPDLAEAWLQLGKLYVQLGKKDEAKKAFLSAETARGGNYEEARLELERL